MVTHKIVNGNYRIVNGNYRIVNGNYRIVNGKIVNGTARPPNLQLCIEGVQLACDLLRDRVSAFKWDPKSKYFLVFISENDYFIFP